MSEPQAIDPKALRKVLASFATGVTIITTNDASGQPVGVTANSFSSVSLSPPLVLWSLSRNAFSMPAFESNGYWAVHILAHHQESLSNQFARSGDDKFAGMSLEPGINGLPLIQGCAARLQCRTALKYEGGDHLILVGEVLQYEAMDTSPLVFHAGRYAVALQNPEPLSLSAAPQDSSIGHTENFVGYLLWRAYFQFFAGLRTHLMMHDLTPVEYYLLCVLAVKDGRSLDEINAINALSEARASQETVLSLIEKGFIRPLSDNADSACLYLSEEGYARSQALMQQAWALEAKIEQDIGTADALALKGLLKRVITRTQTEAPHPWDTFVDAPASARVSS